MGTTQQAKYFQAIEYILFFGLCGLSVVFMYGVLDKFLSGKTSFSQSEEKIKELPTFIFCLFKANPSMHKYEYGTDFTMSYDISDKNGKFRDTIVLKEGKNSTSFEENIYLEEMPTLHYEHCFKITSILTNKYMIKEHTNISLIFNKSLTQEDLPTYVKIFVTSEKNSYGVVFDTWKNGRVMITQVDTGMSKRIVLYPEEYRYLKCSHETFYGCMSRIIAANLKGSKLHCSFAILPSIPVCENSNKSDTEEFDNIWRNASDQCNINVCATLEYFGEGVTYEKYHGNNINFKYEFPSNSTTVYEEYLVYDAINTIGSVGGTLGMCIGFSFTGLISSMINILEYAIFIVKRKFANRKFLKSTSHNESMNLTIKSKQNGMMIREEKLQNDINFEENLVEKISKQLEEKFGQVLDGSSSDYKIRQLKNNFRSLEKIMDENFKKLKTKLRNLETKVEENSMLFEALEIKKNT